jgi:hypothetical protein
LLRPFDTLPGSVIEAMEGRGVLFQTVRGGRLVVVVDDWLKEDVAALPTTLTSEQIRQLRRLSVDLNYRIGRPIHRDPDQGLLVVEGKLTRSDFVTEPEGLLGR